MNRNTNKQSLKQIRWLTQGLIASCALNVALITTLAITFFKDGTEAKYKLKPVEMTSAEAGEISPKELLQSLLSTDFLGLEHKLQDSTHVQHGYHIRDFALSVLTAKYKFHVTKALEGQTLSRRLYTFSFSDQDFGLEMFAGLQDKDYKQIQTYLAQEKWPYTGEGLFDLLKSSPENKIDTTLIEAFYLSDEFLLVEALLNRGESSVQRGQLLALLLEGEWEGLSKFCEEQQSKHNLSTQRKAEFLWDYIVQGSKEAAQILVEMGASSLSKQLEDKDASEVLSLLEDNTPAAETFALEIMLSPRDDGLRELAARTLYRLSGEHVPQNFTYRDALERFAPQELVAEPEVKAEKKLGTKKITPKKELAKENQYVVQVGDTLWKIAQRYKVDMEALRKANALGNDVIKPGRVLTIPR